MKNNYTVSVIIINYNSSAYTIDCVKSVFEKTDNSISTEVIVVDNASQDGSIAMVQKDFPRVHLITNKENYGFAKGCNIGAAVAKGKYLLFLNSDVELEEDTIQELMKTAESNNAGIVGCTLRNPDGTDQRSYGAFYTIPNIIRLLYGGEKAELKHYRMRETGTVDWVTGGCMFVKREDFQKLHGFDEKLFMYMEDVELCYRAHHTGIPVYCNPAIVVQHLGQGSSNKTFAIVQIYKGLQYFYKKHKNPVQYYLVKSVLMVKAVLSLVIGYGTGNGYLKRTYTQAFKTL